MKLLVILASILVLGSIFQVSYGLDNSFEWNFDGAVSSSGCDVLNGKIVDENNSQSCIYRDKVFKIVNTYPGCGEALTQWTDPETQKIFNYVTTCDHPFFCDKDGGGNAFFEKYGYGEYVDHDYVNGLYFGENIWFTSEFAGDICYGLLDLTYSKDDNRIDVDIDGQWNHTIISIAIPPQLHTSELEVLIDNEPYDYSIKKIFKGNTLVRENSILQVIPSKSNHLQTISIFPHDIIDPYRTSVVGKEFLDYTNLFSSTPKKQLENGILPENIKCKLDFILVNRIADNSPACVKPSTAEKLIERGWAKNIEEKISDSYIIKYSPVLSKGTGVDLKDEELIELLKEKQEQFDIAFDDLGMKGLYPIVGGSFSIGNNVYSLDERYVGKPIALDIHVLKEKFTKTTLEKVNQLVRKYVGDEIDIVYSKGGYVIPTPLEKSESLIEDTFGDLGRDHIHAGILVKIFGDDFDFSRSPYQIKAPWIHFEGSNGNTIHRHATGVPLSFLFDSLKLGLNNECYTFQDGRNFCTNDEYSLKFYINRNQVPDITDYEIQDGDKILISYGAESEGEIVKQLVALENLELNP